MTDDVAKAICFAAAASYSGRCPACDANNGACTMWEAFRGEARAAISAAYEWNRRERRWPSYVKK